MSTVGQGSSGSEGDLLAVFSGSECRGVAEARTNPFNDDYIFLLMAYGNKADGEELSISYYDAKNNVVYDNIETIRFEENMVKGNAIDSYVVSYNEQVIPTEYKMSSAYPNPFNPSTNISFSIADPGYTNIAVYNLQGRLVSELVNDYRDVGEYNVAWNASNVSSGVYFIQMYINGFSSSQKVMLVK